MIDRLTSITPGAIRDKINELIAEVRRYNLTAGHGIRLQKRPSGTIIESTARSGASPAQDSSGSNGPFALSVSVDDNNIMTLCVKTGIVYVPGRDYILMPDFSHAIEPDRLYQVYLVSSVVSGTEITINYALYLDGACIFGPAYGGGFWFREIGVISSGSPSNYVTGNQEILGYWL